MTTAPLIRSARPGDFVQVLDLLQRCGLPREGLAAHFEHAVVAEIDGVIVGTAAVEIYPDGALLRSVAVDPGHRGKQFGLRLSARAVHLASVAGAPSIYLLTETAASFFPRLGFQPTSREGVPPGVASSPEFNGACPDSAAVMARPLD
jgi:amino-acid N-acetyltransferase